MLFLLQAISPYSFEKFKWTISGEGWKRRRYKQGTEAQRCKNREAADSVKKVQQLSQHAKWWELVLLQGPALLFLTFLLYSLSQAVSGDYQQSVSKQKFNPKHLSICDAEHLEQKRLQLI